MKHIRLLAAALIVVAASPAFAWNALGHKVIPDIAWQQLDAATRDKIAATLRRHPRFDEDFAKQMPADVDEDRWIFQQAAVWPDMARGSKARTGSSTIIRLYRNLAEPDAEKRH